MLDDAGDGRNNDGLSLAQTYATFPFDGVTVNALIVNGADFEAGTGLIVFSKGQAIRGPGLFVEIAHGFENHERAMCRKLERKMTPPLIGDLTAIVAPKG